MSKAQELDERLCHQGAKTFDSKLRAIGLPVRRVKIDVAHNKSLFMSRVTYHYMITGKIKRLRKMLDKRGFKVVMTEDETSTYSKGAEFNGRRFAVQVKLLAIPGALVCKFFVGLPRGDF